MVDQGALPLTNLRRAGEDYIHSQPYRLTGAVFVLAGAGLAAYSVSSRPLLSDQLIELLISAAFVAAGVASCLYRNEVVLTPSAGRVRAVQGFPWNRTEYAESFDELTFDIQQLGDRSSATTAPYYQVLLSGRRFRPIVISIAPTQQDAEAQVALLKQH